MLLSNAYRRLTALRQAPTVQRINGFLASPAYILLMAALTALCNLAGLEVVVYPLFVLIAVYTCLLGKDLLALMPLLLFCYLAPSRWSNPGRFDTSFFYRSGGLLTVLAVILVLSVVFRVLTDPRWGGKAFFTKKRSLAPGLLLLWLAFSFSGIASADFGLKSIAFGFLEGAAFAVPYFLFSAAVDWENTRKDYFAWIGFAAGCLLLAELLGIYCGYQVVSPSLFNADRFGRGDVVLLIHRGQIYTGWGMHNNIGGMLAMMIPFAFYLASRYRKGWIGTVMGSLFLVGVIFTCSRGSILFGFAAWAVCIVLLILSAKNRRGNLIALCAVILTVVTTVGLFYGELKVLFYDLISMGADPSGRDWLYRNAWELFTQNPLFGSTFYPPEDMSWSWSHIKDFLGFFPARWHNTPLQLLATGGICAMAVYLFHRFQTLRLFLRDKTREKAFIGCAVLVLLGCSLLDCHLFNIGPTLFYSMVLAFVENCVRRTKL